MKQIKVEIEYTEDKGLRTMKTKVNGKSTLFLPEAIRKWIAKDYLDELMITKK